MTLSNKAVAKQDQSSVERDDDEDLPPGYSMALSTTNAAERPATFGRTIPGLPAADFSKYAPLGSKVSEDFGSTTIIDASLCKSPQALTKFLQEQLAIPPMPEIRIKGTHKLNSGWSDDEVDFDIRLNMVRYFLPRDGEQRLGYTTLVARGNGKLKSRAAASATQANGVQQWAEAFCRENAIDKR